MIPFTAFFFYVNCAVVLSAAAAALLTTRGPRVSLACFMVSMVSLVGVFALMGAHVIAVFQFLFCASLGLIFFFAIDLVGDPTDTESSASSSPGWRWLVVVLGVAGASFMASVLYKVVPNTPASDTVMRAHSTSVFEKIGVTVLVEHGIAVLGIGLLLLAAAIGAGFLANRGRTE